MRSAIWLSICVAISALLLGAGNAKVGVVFSSGYDETDFFDYNIQYPASWSLVAQDDTTAIPKTVTVGADGGGVITTVTSSGSNYDWWFGDLAPAITNDQPYQAQNWGYWSFTVNQDTRYQLAGSLAAVGTALDPFGSGIGYDVSLTDNSTGENLFYGTYGNYSDAWVTLGSSDGIDPYTSGSLTGVLQQGHKYELNYMANVWDPSLAIGFLSLSVGSH